ncbi:exported hypothetical protein [Agrobacterium tumefaciens str. B6]|uniref:Uncharacterized protein n=1 Tax=Agrobacterium tumefaciens str. B6 TaxID=1183423 RepID=A0A822UWM5_AGRTU|nr:exported hypothetical protein [Agrobacterium tumefaciens str. B6]
MPSRAAISDCLLPSTTATVSNARASPGVRPSPASEIRRSNALFSRRALLFSKNANESFSRFVPMSRLFVSQPY